MNEEQTILDDKSNRTWLDKLSDALMREPKDRTQLVDLLRDAQQRNLLDQDALAMIEGVMQVSEMQVREIMIPRTQMVVVELNQTPENYLPTIIDSGHSRFPVIEDKIDEVAGILLAKDLLAYYKNINEPNSAFNIRDFLRPAVFIPESKRLNVLLKEFRSSRNHIAIVVDEYGGVSGLVTIEDVLEQIVGEIEDEFDIDEDVYINKHNDATYTVKALTPIDEFNEYFASTFGDEEFDTIGGLVINAFGRLPKRGEHCTVNGFKFKILRSDNRRLHLLQVSHTQN